MQASDQFDIYAKDYEQRFLKNPLAEYQRSIVYELLRQHLSPGKKILDVGCGPGSDFDFYKSLSLQIDAIDISREMVKAARQQAKRLGLNVRIARSALEDFVPDITYDVIILNFGVINSISNPENALKSLQKILAKNGLIFIVAMPPMHIFSFKADLLHLRFLKIYKRLIKRQSVTNDDFTFYYYSSNIFKTHFKIEERCNLCSILPSPEQYKNSSFARAWTKLFINLDKKLTFGLPEFFGGDHIIYMLSKKKSAR